MARLFTNFQAASAVIGQANADIGEPNQGLDVSDRGLDAPQGLALGPNGELLVVDYGNNRVLAFSTVPESSGAAAQAVIGQSRFDTDQGRVQVDGLNGPTAVAAGAGKVAVADKFSHRVLIYDQMPAPGSVLSARLVIGQSGFTSSDQDCGPNSLRRPSGVAITPSGQLIVADSGNHRVLVWAAIPSDPLNVPPPTLVLGQASLDNCVSNDDEPQNGAPDIGPDGKERASAKTLSSPTTVWSDDDRLVVVDALNDRVLIWTGFPRDNFQAANIVLGHSTFSDTEPNSESDGPGFTEPTARTLNLPQGVHSDGKSLVVADTNNNRVLIWNTFPTTSFQPADVVLGHASSNQRVTDDLDGNEETDTPTSRVLKYPSQVLLTGDTLLVSDTYHNRILLFRR